MNTQSRKPPLSEEAFAHLGGGEVAYVRETQAKELTGDFPAVRALPPTAKLFVLHAADGTPIMLGDDRDAVLANAREHSLEPVSLH